MQNVQLDDDGQPLVGDLAAEVGNAMRTYKGRSAQKLRRLEAQIIFDALHSCDGDRKAAADLLGIHVSSLYRKLEECAELELLDHETPEFKESLAKV